MKNLEIKNNMPHDTGIERAIIALLFNDDALDVIKIELKDFNNSDDENDKNRLFWDKRHQIIFRAVFQKEGNVASDIIASVIRDLGKMDIVGEDYYEDLTDNIDYLFANIEEYCEILKNKFLLRKAISLGTDMVKDSMKAGADPDEILSATQDNIFSVSEGTKGYELTSLVDISHDIFRNIMTNGGKTNTISTGYKDLDEKLGGGLSPGQLIILAARPGMGKSAFALSLAYELLKKNPTKRAAFFSLEMNKDELVYRLLSMVSDVDSKKIRSGKIGRVDSQKLIQSTEILNNIHLFINDDPGLKVLDIRTNVNSKAFYSEDLDKRSDLGLIIVDYLQLLKPADSKMPREQQVAQMSRSLKELAKDLKVPILVLAQLNRDADNSEIPKLSNLRESGSIEQDADIVLFVDRPYARGDKEKDETEAAIHIGKQRAGQAPATIELKWFASKTYFGSVENSYSRYGDMSENYDESQDMGVHEI